MARESLGVEVQRSLGRIEGKLDSYSVSMQQHMLDDTASFLRVNQQIDAINRTIWKFAGVIGFLTVLIPSAIAFYK